MSELVFIVERSEGALTASAIGPSIVTQADTIEALRANIDEAVACHFDDADPDLRVRLRFTHILPHRTR